MAFWCCTGAASSTSVLFRRLLWAAAYPMSVVRRRPAGAVAGSRGALDKTAPVTPCRDGRAPPMTTRGSATVVDAAHPACATAKTTPTRQGLGLWPGRRRDILSRGLSRPRSIDAFLRELVKGPRRRTSPTRRSTPSARLDRQARRPASARGARLRRIWSPHRHGGRTPISPSTVGRRDGRRRPQRDAARHRADGRDDALRRTLEQGRDRAQGGDRRHPAWRLAESVPPQAASRCQLVTGTCGGSRTIPTAPMAAASTGRTSSSTHGEMVVARLALTASPPAPRPIQSCCPPIGRRPRR